MTELTAQILGMYLGCEVQVLTSLEEGIVESGYNGILSQISTDGFVHVGVNGGSISKLTTEIKPILRRLSDMSEGERKELWRLVFSAYNKFNELGLNFMGRTVWIEERNTFSDPRWVMSQGIERLGIEMNGTVWADCDLHTWKHNQHEVTLWFLSHSFDLFGLIDAGLAIEKKHE